MLKWLRRPRADAPEPQAADDDSGEDEYATEKELDREADPAGDMPRIKTDDI
jgi:hypothetical protein